MRRKASITRRAPWLRIFLGGTTGALLSLSWVGGILQADPPTSTPSSAPQTVEMWHGVRRIDRPLEKPEPKTEAASKGQAHSSPPPLVDVPSPLSQGLPLLPVPPVTLEIAGPATPGGLGLSPKTETRPVSGSETASSSAKAEPEAAHAPITNKTESASPSTPIARTSPGEPEAVARREDAIGMQSVVYFAGIVAGALLAPLTLLCGLFVLLRRLHANPGPVIRVEYAGGQQAVPVEQLIQMFRGVWAEGEPPARSVTVPVPAKAEEPEPFTGEYFDIGPTFEEERLMKEQEEKDREAGVLQKLYEDNLQLQNELRQPETATC